MRPMRPRAVAVLALLSITCSGPKKTSTPKPTGDPLMIDDDPGGDGLRFRLSEGAPEDGKTAQLAVPPATPLGDADVAKLTGRLPAVPVNPDDKKAFALREKSLPPPRTGETVTTTFPPPIALPVPEVAAGKPLQVLRHQPDGDVPLAPVVSVTFSHPMVAITSLAALDAKEAPVKLTPTPPGKWRWIGTKTIVFEPEAGRMPMATAYTIEVPAGTKAATGEALGAAAKFSFRTPPPQVVTEVPGNGGGPYRRDPVIFLGFDQKVDPQAVLATLKADGAKLRLATADEVAGDKGVKALTEAAVAGRFVTLKPEGLLPGDTNVTIHVGPGTPSLEGPRTTEKAHDVTFRTYGPMKIEEAQCGWGGECRPLTPFQIRFSNPIDLKTFKKEMVKASPEIRGMRVNAYDRYLEVSGITKGRTTYTIALDGAIPDQFGQTLGSREERTFTTTSAEAQLSAQGGDLVILDPAGGPRFSVYTINHKKLSVKAYAVGPEDWRQWRKFREDFWRDDRRTPPPGRLAIDTTVETKGEADELTETRIDLAKAMKDGLGHVVLVVEPTTKPKDRWSRQVVVAWVQSTHLGLDAVADATDLRVFVTNLADGAPKGGVEVTGVGAGGSKVQTAGDGTATMPLGTSGLISVLVARAGGDTAILPEQSSWWSDGGWARQTPGDDLRWYVADDRQLYKPGETVKVKGWLRLVGLGKGGDVGASPGVKGVSWKLRDSVGNEVLKGTGQVSLLGGFDLSMTLPKTMNLGGASLELTADWPGNGRQTYHQIEVQEFRTPEFEVGTTVASGPFFVGGHAIVDVNASYFAGGGLANADTTWNVTTSPGSFQPPGRDEWTFGIWIPWWWDGPHIYGGRGKRGGFFPGGGGEDTTQTFAGKTDAGGKHHLRIDFTGVRPPRASTVRAEATVMDVNRQAWSASSTLLVHPAAQYVGLKTPRLFVQAGEPLELEAIVVDLDGKIIPGREIKVVAERLEWEQDGEEYKEVPKDPVTQTIASATDGVKLSLATKEGGKHRVRATITDLEGRANLTELTIWVAGGKQPPKRDLEEEEVQLVPDKKEYKRGETAKVLVLAPFADAEGVLTLRRSGVIEERRFTMKGTSHTLEIKIQEAWTPNVVVHVALTGKAPRTDDKGKPLDKLEPRPAYAKGELVLAIPPLERRLAVEVVPKERGIDPGGATELTITVKDFHGKPAAAGEVAVIAVDEAVLSMTGYQIPDPIEMFYAARDAGASDLRNRAYVLLANPDDVGVKGAQGGPGGGGAANQGMADRMSATAAPPAAAEAAPTTPSPKPMRRAKEEAKDAERKPDAGADANAPIQVRTNFAALALFSPTVAVGADGKAVVKLALPDNLTRYRITAVAIGKDDQGKTFGKGESTVTARLPLMVRPSPPRFLNFGDVFELPVVIQNQTEAAMTVDVVVRAQNAKLTNGNGRRVVVPPLDRVEVRFPAAAELAGTARFQLAAASGRYADAATVELPVWTPATTEAFATYGTVDSGAIKQPVEPPPNVVPIFGGLEVTTSSTALQALTDAVIYLVRYPYECSEQMASRVLALAALRDVLAAFQAEGLPAPAVLAESVKKDVEMIARLQNDDGGFAFWRRGDESWPYLTIHVALALQLAKDKGYAVPAQVQARALAYLRDVESHFPSYYGEEIRRVLSSYALNVRLRMGDRDEGKARKLIAGAGGVEKMPIEGLAWLLPVLKGSKESAEIQHFFANKVVETAGNAHFQTAYTDGGHLLLHSNRRVDGLILDALIDVDPKNDLIPKLVSGLLAQRTRGRWENTQENAFILIALDHYFRVYESVTPNFVARAWLGTGYAGDHTFKGRTTERHRIDIPMQTVVAGGKKDLILQKDGAGRMYYRIGMSYAPADLRPPPLDAGFTVERRYEGVDKKDDVKRDADGTWRVKAGARVRVTLTMVAPSRRYHVALVDPLPAGLEALNPALATTGTLPPPPDGSNVGVYGGSGLGGPGYPGMYWRWWGPWYDHENLRDERVEAFSALLWEGVWTYAYVARATTPGTFVVPPPKAEEMYHPETFGRGAGDRLIVE